MGREKKNPEKVFENYQIVHNAYVDLTGLLKELPTFFSERQYDFYEMGLSEKNIGVGDHIESTWTASREVTEYIKFNMLVFVFARDVRKVVLESGEVLYWARLMIKINTEFEKNYRDTFGKGHWGQFWRQVYERYVKNPELDKYKGKMYWESRALIADLKKHLK